MIEPRRVTLIRVTTLAAAQRALALVATAGSPLEARDRLVLVPSRTAGEELRRTIEQIGLVDGWVAPRAVYERLGLAAPVHAGAVAAMPGFATREEWHHAMAERLDAGRSLLTPTERELLLGLAAEVAARGGAEPPFAVRAGLISEMLALYDALRRRLRTTSDFERVLVDRLEPAADYDRGASRLLQQTRFLVASYRAYEHRLEADGLLDEHRLRAAFLAAGVRRPLRHLLLAVADRTADAGGLWPADFDLVMRLPGLLRADVVATDRALSAGLYERLQVALPELDVCDLRDLDTPRPVLVAPDRSTGGLFFSSRDREDELADVARRITFTDPSGASPDETAIVYQRPLPYLYLARQLLDDLRVPWEATDALPLAGEPYAAAFALALDAPLAGFSREAVFALLASPLFCWGEDRWSPAARDLGWLERELAARGFLGSADALRAFADSVAAADNPQHRARMTRFSGAIREMLDALAPLGVPARLSEHVACLVAFLDRHEKPPTGAPEVAVRHLRARAAVRAVLEEVASASARFGDRILAIDELSGFLRRWIEGQTFQPRVSQRAAIVGAGPDHPTAPAPAGLRLVDAVAARFGHFTHVHIVGLVEGEWPEPVRQSVFYPAGLLRDLGWPPDRERQLAARASFFDLTSVASRTTTLSTFTLEQDTLVQPSIFLEDLELAELPVVREAARPATLLSSADALSHGVVEPAFLSAPALVAALLRQSRSDPASPRFHGASGPYRRAMHAVTAVETYLACPFKYFASRVLRLEEEPGDDVGLDPRERGRIVHEVFQAFFEEWASRGRGGVTATLLPEARRLFRDIVDARLAALPASERASERLRLLGSPASPGMGERVLRLEAERDLDLEARLLEFDLGGEYEFAATEPRRVRLRGIADRIDLTSDGYLHLFDYKTGRPPHRRRAIQLPVYGLCAEQRLDGFRGRSWRVGEAAYLALAGPRPYSAVVAVAGDRDEAFGEGASRLVAAVDAIERGEFPPRPAELSLCASCAWAAICRKDYVDPPA